MVQRFAGGGTVFRRPSWSKVPGVGNEDTVPARLEAGSFVVRKAASSYYGDGLMGRIARFASGGGVGKQKEWGQWFGGVNPFALAILGAKPRTDAGGIAPMIDPKVGWQSGDSFQTNAAPISFDTREIPAAALTASNVIEYAREMLAAVGSTNPLLGYLATAIPDAIAALQRDPTDRSMMEKLLQMAETIGANPYVFSMWGKTASSRGTFTPTWFVDWVQKFRAGEFAGGAGQGVQINSESFAKRFFQSPDVVAALRRFKPAGMAAGGSSTDTVPALLTPGEWVIRKPAVARYGSGLLHAINSMQVPRAALQNMLAPPQVRRFAYGGPVSFNTPERSMAAPGGSSITVNLQASAADLLSIDNVRRFIIPVLDGINKRSR